ncbi:atherin-like, partial [Canis lupus familiaris]|uniref:atherin-like n=1 Tax=Canis lupus familiaris TaxID=9615 RepID=UPI0018F3337B
MSGCEAATASPKPPGQQAAHGQQGVGHEGDQQQRPHALVGGRRARSRTGRGPRGAAERHGAAEQREGEAEEQRQRADLPQLRAPRRAHVGGHEQRQEERAVRGGEPRAGRPRAPARPAARPAPASALSTASAFSVAACAAAACSREQRPGGLRLRRRRPGRAAPPPSQLARSTLRGEDGGRTPPTAGPGAPALRTGSERGEASGLQDPPAGRARTDQIPEHTTGHRQRLVRDGNADLLEQEHSRFLGPVIDPKSRALPLRLTAAEGLSDPETPELCGTAVGVERQGCGLASSMWAQAADKESERVLQPNQGPQLDGQGEQPEAVDGTGTLSSGGPELWCPDNPRPGAAGTDLFSSEPGVLRGQAGAANWKLSEFRNEAEAGRDGATAQRGKDRDTGAKRATGGDRQSVSARASHAGGSAGVAPEQSGVPWLNGDEDEIV